MADICLHISRACLHAVLQSACLPPVKSQFSLLLSRNTLPTHIARVKKKDRAFFDYTWNLYLGSSSRVMNT